MQHTLTAFVAIQMYFNLMLLLANYCYIQVIGEKPQFALLDSILKKFSLTGNIDLHDAFAEPTEVLNSYGHQGERHTVTTDDGYILSVYRIPNQNINAIPILLMHGLGRSSAQFLMNRYSSPVNPSRKIIRGIQKLSHKCANAQLYGSVTWINMASQDCYNGTKVNGTKVKWYQSCGTKLLYWRMLDLMFGWEIFEATVILHTQSIRPKTVNFGTLRKWQEMAEQDMPFTIDYILNVTRHSKLICAAHSMGTIVGFAMFSTQPSYNNKVAGFFALSPVAFLNYSPIIFLKHIPPLLPQQIVNIDGWKLNFATEICASKRYFFICEYLFAGFEGYDPYLINKMPTFVAVGRHGSSIKTYFHLAQIRAHKAMHKYDYGERMNQKLYNSSMPPAYNLSEISVPVFIFYGANDASADPLDVELLSRELRNLKAKELCPWPLCAHSDNMEAMNMKELYITRTLFLGIPIQYIQVRKWHENRQRVAKNDDISGVRTTPNIVAAEHAPKSARMFAGIRPNSQDLLLLKYCYLQTEVLNSYGHPSEKHKVKTDDGYILSVYRIPNQNLNAIPILLMHGLGRSSAQFLMNRYSSPAFILADAGFDVWIGNFRGNIYTSHTKYTLQDSEFWNFTAFAQITKTYERMNVQVYKLESFMFTLMCVMSVCANQKTTKTDQHNKDLMLMSLNHDASDSKIRCS
uniref:Partial AB-hydrolase lipase domain-containing protein n=1 Tax=Strigamia maritima TaxID=126957 RepID=T1J810_STRMM